MKFTDHIIPSMFSTATFSPPKWLDHGRTSKRHDDKKNNGLCINPYHFYQSGKYPFLLLVLLAIFSIPVQKSGNLGSQSTPVVYKRSCVILNTCVMLVQRATPYPKMSWGFSALALNKTESLPDLFSLAYSVTSHFFQIQIKVAHQIITSSHTIWTCTIILPGQMVDHVTNKPTDFNHSKS